MCGVIEFAPWFDLVPSSHLKRVDPQFNFSCVRRVKCNTISLSQIDAANAECEKLKQCNSELQRQRDGLEDEKDDVTKDKDRQIKENQRW